MQIMPYSNHLFFTKPNLFICEFSIGLRWTKIQASKMLHTIEVILTGLQLLALFNSFPLQCETINKLQDERTRYYTNTRYYIN